MSTKVIVRNDGPLRLEGEDIVLQDDAGNRWGLAGRTVVSLCRCGQSQNKPFCDSSHLRTGFRSSIRIDPNDPSQGETIDE